MQAKFMTIVLREFNKSREITKHRDQRRFAEQVAGAKQTQHGSLNDTAGTAESGKKSDASKRKQQNWGARSSTGSK